jgi:hypothetical protein
MEGVPDGAGNCLISCAFVISGASQSGDNRKATKNHSQTGTDGDSFVESGGKLTMPDELTV